MAKRKRGRPRKQVEAASTASAPVVSFDDFSERVKGVRGRPRKNPVAVRAPKLPLSRYRVCLNEGANYIGTEYVEADSIEQNDLGSLVFRRAGDVIAVFDRFQYALEDPLPVAEIAKPVVTEPTPDPSEPPAELAPEPVVEPVSSFVTTQVDSPVTAPTIDPGAIPTSFP